jgi:hypothetical protein
MIHVMIVQIGRSAKMNNADKIVYETESAEEVNQLCLSKEWRQPIYDAHKSKYIMIRKKVK